MDLKEFTSGAGAPLTKPWLTPVVYSLEAGSVAVTGRVRQELTAGAGGHLTPYNLWAGLNEAKVSGPGPSLAMGTFVGPVSIPGASCYPGMTTRIVVDGLINSTGADNLQFTIRDLAGAVIHAGSPVIVLGGATGNAPVSLEFKIQIRTLGAAGVAVETSSVGVLLNGAIVAATPTFLTNSTTFSTTGNVEYYLYFQSGDPTSDFTRKVGYSNVIF